MLIMHSTGRHCSSSSAKRWALNLQYFNGKQVGTARNYSDSREARFLKKLMSGSNKPKPKKTWYNDVQPHAKALKEFNFFSASSKLEANSATANDNSSSGNTNIDETRKLSGRTSRRVGVLNTVFLEAITSLLSTGEVEGSEALIGLGLDITFVQITPDFKFINVFWHTSGSEEKEKHLEVILNSIGHKLRHTLTQLRVIGMVPPIQFVKDNKYAQLLQVERLLEKADYGDDYVPTLQSDLSRKTAITLSPELKAKIEIMDKAIGSSDSEDDVDGLESEDNQNCSDSTRPISYLDPEFMRQDILGVKRDRIMNGIMGLLSKSRIKRNARQDSSIRVDQDASYISPEQLAIDVQNQTNRTQSFLNYLKLKQREQDRAEKRQSTEAFERQFYESVRKEMTLKSNQQKVSDVEQKFYNELDLHDDEDYLSEEEENENSR